MSMNLRRAVEESLAAEYKRGWLEAMKTVRSFGELDFKGFRWDEWAAYLLATVIVSAGIGVLLIGILDLIHWLARL